jgi:lactate 2-monooxygenase
MTTTFKSNDNVVQDINSTEYFPISFGELEDMAKQNLSAPAFSYIFSGADGEETMRNNANSFAKYAIVPRFLNDVSKSDTSITLFGRTYPSPLLLSPVGVLKLANEMGDIAVARAAAHHQIPFIQSTVSSFSIEEVAKATNDSSKWFQLYWSNHEEISFSMAKRAEKAGYEAIVLTVDTVTLGWREADLRHRFSPLALGYGQGNYETDDVFLSTIENDSSEAIIQGIIDNVNYPALSWKHVAELKKRTSLPILLKGILHPEDALLAMEHGVDGIIVSNHGGRQLDGVISSIDALPDIVKSVNGEIPVLYDSGIRRGIDALKALALGANGVLIGRPFVYSLAVGGESGVQQFLSHFLKDFQSSMILAGISNIEQLHSLKIVRS